MELDDSKSNGLSARISSLESENEGLRRTVIKHDRRHKLFTVVFLD